MSNRLEEFRARREAQNTRVHAADHLGIKRFFALDTQAYADGALSGKDKEMLGLAPPGRCHQIMAAADGAEVLDVARIAEYLAIEAAEFGNHHRLEPRGQRARQRRLSRRFRTVQANRPHATASAGWARNSRSHS